MLRAQSIGLCSITAANRERQCSLRRHAVGTCECLPRLAPHYWLMYCHAVRWHVWRLRDLQCSHARIHTGLPCRIPVGLYTRHSCARARNLFVPHARASARRARRHVLLRADCALQAESVTMLSDAGKQQGAWKSMFCEDACVLLLRSACTFPCLPCCKCALLDVC